MQSWTALIPAIFGIPILLASLLARNPEKLKLGMHIAAVFGLLGFLAPLGRIIPTVAKGTFEANSRHTNKVWAKLNSIDRDEFRGLIAFSEGRAIGLTHYLFHRHCWRVHR